MFAPNKKDPYYYDLKFLESLLYCPRRNSELKKYKITSALIRFLTSFPWTACLVYCIISIKDGLFIDLSNDLEVFVELTNCMLVCIFYQIKWERWFRFYRDICDTSVYGSPPTAFRAYKIASRFSVVYITNSCIAIISHSINSLTFKNALCVKLKEQKNWNKICGTIVSMWYPGGEPSTILKIIFNIYQVFSAATYMLTATVLIAMNWKTGALIVAKIHHLKARFFHVFEGNSALEVRQRMRAWIQYHCEIIRMIEEFNKLTKIMFGQVSFLSALIVGCNADQVSNGKVLAAFTHFLAYFGALFALCEIGQRIQDETVNIEEAIYASDWYSYLRFAKDVQLILIRCQKPLVMETTPLGTFSYALPIIVLKTAYSYFALLTNTTK